MSEPALRCPGCGAPSSKDAASCDYCGASLSTMTCASCFGPMFVGSRFCNHCGAEVQRELLDDDVELHCPRCTTPLQGLRLGSTEALECGACGGLWLTTDALQRLVSAAEEASAVVATLAARIPAVFLAPGDVRYLPCPGCAKLMNRTNFSRVSGVIVDVCKEHGLWLDRGELQAVLRFVDQGGLTVARERERVQAVEDQRHRALMAAEAHYGPTLDFVERVDTTLYHEVHTDTIGSSVTRDIVKIALWEMLGMAFSLMKK